MLVVYDAFSLEPVYKTVIPHLKETVNMQWLFNLVILNDTSNVIVIDSKGSMIAEMMESIQIANVTTFHSWIVIQLDVSLGCKLYDVESGEARFIRNVKSVACSDNHLFVSFTDGMMSCFDRELRVCKSVALGCPVLQVCDQVIYGYDVSVFRIAISDVESVAFRSVSFGMDGGVSRIVAFKKDVAACMMNDGSVLLLNCLLGKIMKRVIAGGECVVFKERVMEGGVHRYEASHGYVKQCTRFGDCCTGPDAHWAVCREECVYIFKQSALIACLQQLDSVISINWHPTLCILTILCQNAQCVYVWQAQGAHCIPIPFDGFHVREIKWHPEGECALLIGERGCCVVVPEESMMVSGGEEMKDIGDVQERESVTV